MTEAELSKLRAVSAYLQRCLEMMMRIFRGPVQITLVIRHAELPNGALVATNDALEPAIAAIRHLERSGDVMIDGRLRH